jgi:hypothetical protein
MSRLILKIKQTARGQKNVYIPLKEKEFKAGMYVEVILLPVNERDDY